MHKNACGQRIGDYVRLQRGNTYQSALLGKPGPILLGLASINRNGGFKNNNLKTYGGSFDQRMLLRSGDIYVSLKDVTQSADLLGSVARVPHHIKLGRLTQDTVKLIFKEEESPKDYIYWILRTPQYREYCRAHTTGTTNLGLPREDFLSFSIPPLTPDRAELAILLQALDDKIDLNRRMNETLEAMAQAIFRDWFVDFGPTRRQMAGATDPVQIMGGLTPDPEKAATLAPLFPPTLAANGLPEGWEKRPLLAIARLISGGTPSTKERRYWDGAIKWASAKDVSQCGEPFLLETEKTITEIGLEKSSTRIVPKRATVVVARGATTGRFCVFGEDIAMNQTCYALVSKEGTPYLLRQIFGHLVESLVLGGHGSVFNTITTRTLEHATAVYPQQKAGLMFEDFVTPFFERMLSNQKESRTLAAMRDLLLPKLMSGEIRLSEAKPIIEAA